MHIKPINTLEDYEAATKRIESLMDSSPGEEKFEELDILSVLVESFEKKNFPIEAPDPIEAIKFRMEQLGLNRSDLEKVMFCGRGRVSEILNKKRALTLSMIRALNQAFQIPSEVLVQEYALSRTNLHETQKSRY